jgi:hypothetical protein
MRATNRLHPGFGQAEVLHFAFPNQILDGASNIFNGNVRVDAMLIEEIDPVRFEPFQ